MIILFLIWYIKIGLIFGLFFIMLMTVSEQDVLLSDVLGTILFYPLIIYHLITYKN